jgi:hypothetical protein
MSVYTNGPSPAYVYSEHYGDKYNDQYMPMTYVNTSFLASAEENRFFLKEKINNPYYTPTTTTYTPYYQNTVSNVDVNSYVPVYQNDGFTDVSSLTAPPAPTPTTPRASDILAGIVIGVIIVIVVCVLFVLL